VSSGLTGGGGTGLLQQVADKIRNPKNKFVSFMSVNDFQQN